MVLWVLTSGYGCGLLGHTNSRGRDAGGGDSDDAQAVKDAWVTDATPTDASAISDAGRPGFGPPAGYQRLSILYDGSDVDDPTLSADELTLAINRGTAVVIFAERASVDQTFDPDSAQVALSQGANPAFSDPELSADAGELIVSSRTVPPQRRLVSSKRSAGGWGPVAPLFEGVEALELSCTLQLDGVHMLLSRAEMIDSASRIISATFDSESARWTEGSTHSELTVGSGVLRSPDSRDGLLVLFEVVETFEPNGRPRTSTLYWAERRNRIEPFSSPQPLEGLNDALLEDEDLAVALEAAEITTIGDPWLSPDRERLYFVVNRRLVVQVMLE